MLLHCLLTKDIKHAITVSAKVVISCTLVTGRDDKPLRDGTKTYKWDKLKKHLQSCAPLKRILAGVKKAESALERVAVLGDLVRAFVERNKLEESVTPSIIGRIVQVIRGKDRWDDEPYG